MKWRRCLFVALIGLALVEARTALGATMPDPADRAAVIAYSQSALGRTLDNFVLTGESGVTRRLSDYRGKPLVLSMVFTGCTQSCPITTDSLANAVDQATSVFGPSRFNVITVGFDSLNDTPARMRAYASSHGIRADNWEFLSADPGTAYVLAEQVGFVFAPDASGFEHLAQTTIIRGDGVVYQHVYGAEFEPPALVEPLKALLIDGDSSFSPIGALIERIRLFCTNYNAATGHYGLNFGILFGLVIGAISLGVLFFILVRAARRAYRPAPPGGSV